MGRFDVWAPLAERVRLSVGDEVVAMSSRRRRLVDSRRAGAGRRGRLRLPARRRRGAAARPAVAAPARRGPRAVAHVRRRGVRLDRRRVDRAPARRSGASTSCTSGRSRPRAPSTPRSAGSTTCASIGVDLVELMPVNAFNGTHNWGYDGVLLVRRRTRRTAGRRRTSASSTAATPPGSAWSRTSSTTTSARRGNYLPLFGPYLKDGGQHLGRPGQPRRRAARRCGATSSTTR